MNAARILNVVILSCALRELVTVCVGGGTTAGTIANNVIHQQPSLSPGIPLRQQERSHTGSRLFHLRRWSDERTLP